MLVNFESYKGGTIEEGQVIKVYVNLRNGKIAIRNKSGKVQGYCDEITITNAHFYVAEKTLKRVREAKSKEVFAYCIGTYQEQAEAVEGQAISFNPFSELDNFYFCNTREEISKEQEFKAVTLKNKKAYV